MGPIIQQSRKKSDPRLSAQIHVIAFRGPAMDYLRRMLAAAKPIPKDTAYVDVSHRPELKRLPNVRRVAGPWRYEIQKGHLQIIYPLGWEMTAQIWAQLMEDAGTLSDYYQPLVKNRGKKDQKTIPAPKVLTASMTRLLTITSKMGAMSWNLPAGPPSLGGSCRGAIPGWRPSSLPVQRTETPPGDSDIHEKMGLHRSWDSVSFRVWKEMHPKGTLAAGRSLVQSGPSKHKLHLPDKIRSKELGALATYYGLTKATTATKDETGAGLKKGPDGIATELVVNPTRYICNGCYALKGQYGNFSNVWGMELRRTWMVWCVSHDPQEFVDVMSLAIEAARVRNARARTRKLGRPPIASRIKKEQSLAEPDPAYFRIHDSGDMITAEYFGLWLQVIDRFPQVKFWSPTRLWFSAEVAAGLNAELQKVRPSGKRGWPANLNFRPSALHFGEEAPSVPSFGGQMGGSGASDPATFVDSKGRHLRCLDGKVGLWQCPAYLPYTEGGGALLQTVGKGAKRKLKQPLAWEESGSCQYAKGLPPTSAKCGTLDQPGPRVQGCRVCWEQRDWHVTYAEH